MVYLRLIFKILKYSYMTVIIDSFEKVLGLKTGDLDKTEPNDQDYSGQVSEGTKAFVSSF